MSALLEVSDLEAQYGWTKVLHGLSFAVESGQITTILGANGAGKTTTLRAVCQMVKTSGQVRFWAELRSSGPREYLIREWEYGGYERAVKLPNGYGSGVEASLANGQLAVRVLSGEFAGEATIHPSS